MLDTCVYLFVYFFIANIASFKFLIRESANLKIRKLNGPKTTRE